MERIQLVGEPIDLLPERAAWWERRSTLVVADLHLGKTATFRALGIPAPEGTTARDLDRLAGLIERLNVSRIVVLGDMLHAVAGRSSEVIDLFAAWRARFSDVEVLLIRGNHDERAGDPPPEWRIECVNGPHADGPLIYQHEPGDDARGHVLCGHVHPAIRLFGRAGESMRAPCFWMGERCTVLPAFGSFTGAKVIRPREGDRVFAVGEGAVAEVPLASI